MTGTQPAQGTVRLVSNVSGMTRVEINSPSKSLIETKRISTTPQVAGESRVGSSAVTALPLHNLLVDPGWFVPEHVIARAITSLRPASVVPATQMDGTTAVGVNSFLTSSHPSHADSMRQMSEMTIFIDQTTSLPVELLYNSHANDNLLKIIPTRIVYGNYQAVQGHMVPFHIQRYEKGLLQDDITITGVVLNSGVASTQYTLN